MAIFRSLSRRDTILILLGAISMHLFSSVLSPSIVINTHLDQYRHLASVPPPKPPPKPPLPAVHKHVDSPGPRAVPIDVPIELAPTLPETTIVSHAPGWTIFRNLYMSEGTLYIVSPQPRTYFPDIRYMTSNGGAAENTPENIASREPTSQHMTIITDEQAKKWWGGDVKNGDRNRVWSVDGNTLLFNDPPQFLKHYYHFVAELLVGAWSFWAGTFTSDSHALSPSHHSSAYSASQDGPLSIHRAIFAHSDSEGWRDGPGFNAYFLRAAFPSLTVEVQRDWEDRAAITARHPVAGRRAWHFPVVLLSDRSAAFRGDACGRRTQRTAAEAYEAMMSTGKLARDWWEPVRKAVLRFAGAEAQRDKAVIVLGDRSSDSRDTAPVLAPLPLPDRVVITYISRQAVRRRLIQEDHQGLVHSLRDLVRRKNRIRAMEGTGVEWELHIVQAEKLTKDEQVRLVGKTTIMLGVHGNGLTHLVLMPPTRVSAVIEMFYPGGFAHDYEWTTRALGMRHFAMWNDTYHSHPNEPDVSYPEGFQGSEIPIYGPAVASLIEDRVEGRL